MKICLGRMQDLNFVEVIYLLLYLTASIQGSLVQVSGNGNICQDEVAVFKCSGSYIIWRIVSSTTDESSTLPVIFSRFERTNATLHILNSSRLLFEATYKNESIISALTIYTPINLNGSTVKCNQESTQILILTYFPAPTILILTPYGSSSFLVQWRPVDETNRTLYEVTVSPPPLHGPHVITHTTSLILPLDTITQYNITVTASLCGNTSGNSPFIVGNCTLHHNPSLSSIQYFTNIVGPSYVIVNCFLHADYETHKLICTEQGHWNQPLSDICRIQNSTIHSDEAVTSVFQPFPPQMSSQFIELSLTEFILTFFGLTVGYLIIFFIMGCLSGMKYSHKKTKNKKTYQEETVNEPTHGPVYEEIKLRDTTLINFSRNAAYETTTRNYTNN